jgi:metal-responsive CopG/Arc/MetJ family transcriptional regulator
MYDKENIIPVLVYLPKQIVNIVDNERGSFSRSRFLSTMAEMYYEELSNYEQHENAPKM